MKQFMDKDFLLSTPTAQHLFHDYADKMPIVDYHCHINPKEIAEDRKFIFAAFSSTLAIYDSRSLTNFGKILSASNAF